MQINYSRQSVKFLKKQDTITQKRIISTVNKLPNRDVKKLQERDGYRLRIGNFRIIFDLNGNIIYIEEINNRGQIYK